MTCKHNWTFVNGLTKRIRCTRCAAMEFVNPQDKFVVEGLKLHDPRPNSIVFYNGNNLSEDNEVMRLSADGVKVNPKFTVDEATGYVIKALDSYLKAMGQKEYERGVIDGRQIQVKTSVDKAVNTMSQRTWVGLTDEDKQTAFDETQEGGGFWEFADAIEAKLKEKNGYTAPAQGWRKRQIEEMKE